MIRLILILLAALAVRVVWKIVRSFLAQRPKEFSARRGKTELRGAVVGCDRCGLHVPEDRALTRGSRTFCSEACAGGPEAGAGTGTGTA